MSNPVAGRRVRQPARRNGNAKSPNASPRSPSPGLACGWSSPTRSAARSALLTAHSPLRRPPAPGPGPICCSPPCGSRRHSSRWRSVPPGEQLTALVRKGRQPRRQRRSANILICHTHGAFGLSTKAIGLARSFVRDRANSGVRRHAQRPCLALGAVAVGDPLVDWVSPSK
jgi:hypothetical protein